MDALWFILGLGFLVLGAELLVRGASRLALSVGISPLVIGLTVVAFGTSSPELAVSIQSAIADQADLAIGNVIGSNIFNVLFILGASALIIPLLVDQQVIRQEVPCMIAASLLLWWFASDGRLTGLEAGMLLGLLMIYTIALIVQSRRAQTVVVEEYEEAFAIPASSHWDRHWSVQLLLIVVGLLLLIVGARWLVEAAVSFARYLGISELVIGLTIVSVGTSLPEVATSIIAAIRGERDIAVGNVIGSNTFNVLGVLGASGLVAQAGLVVSPAVLRFDLLVMVAVALACVPVFATGRQIARWEGFLFLAYYVAYAAYLILDARQHDALGPFSVAMLAVALPLTVIVLVVATIVEWFGSRGRRDSFS